MRLITKIHLISKIFEGRYAIGGADLSVTTDLSCATLLFVDPETETRYVHQMYWLPEDNLYKRVHEDKIPYDKWYEQGWLRLCRAIRLIIAISQIGSLR